MTDHAALVPVLALLQSWATMAREHATAAGRAPSPRLKVLLDCDVQFEALFRSAVDSVDIVSSGEADVRMQVTQVSSRRGPSSCRVTLTGMGPFEGIEAVTQLGGIRRRSPKDGWMDLAPSRDDVGVFV